MYAGLSQIEKGGVSVSKKENLFGMAVVKKVTRL
jgi:hypothetical protein